MCQKDESSDSKVKFRQASNCCERVLILPLFNSLEVLSPASDKTKLFAENFSKNFNFDDSGISLPVLPSRTNVKIRINFCNSQDG